MGLRVNTNVTSLTAQRHMSAVTARLQGNYARLASGLRIATAADDAAGLAISERMRAQIRSLSVAGRNTQDGISMVQTAEGALNEVGNILSRMRELSIQSANGTLSDSDRTTISDEVTALLAEIDRLATASEFNGIALLDGSSTTTSIHVGLNADETIDVTLADTQTSALGVDAVDVSSQTGANTALALIDAAIDANSLARGALGAFQNRLTSAAMSIANARENLSAAESRIRDVDMASETADLTRNTIIQQAAVSVLQQANIQPQIALSLLQG